MSAGARRAAGAVLLLVFAAAVVYAGTRLWHTDVPGGLRSPKIDIDAEFGAEAVHKAESFEAFLRVTALVNIALLLVTLGLYAWQGVRFTRESAAGPIGTGFLLGMLGFALVWLAQLPVTVIDVWWLRRHDVFDVGYVDAIFGSLFQLAVTFLFLCVALLVAMGLARWLRRTWWIPAAAVFVALFAAYSFVTPYLVPGLKDPPQWVTRAADRLEPIEGVDGHVPVRVMPVRKYTDQPNAFAAGLGSSRRVVLFDTLLHEFPRPQVRVALAHEIGHQARQHIAKQIGWFALITLPMALIVALVARRRGGMAVPEAVPLVILVVVVLNLVTAPLQATVSRRYEAEADWAALQATRDPGAMEKLFQGFTHIGRSDPDPPGWWQVLFESHPSALQRVEMANAWAVRERR